MATDLICLRQRKGAFYILVIVHLGFSLGKLHKINKLPNLKTE